MSGMELLILLFCAGGLLVLLAVGAWVLVNKSKLEGQESNQSNSESDLTELDREYAAGDLDEREYDERRAAIQRRSRRE